MCKHTNCGCYYHCAQSLCLDSFESQSPLLKAGTPHRRPQKQLCSSQHWWPSLIATGTCRQKDWALFPSIWGSPMLLQCEAQKIYGPDDISSSPSTKDKVHQHDAVLPIQGSRSQPDPKSCTLWKLSISDSFPVTKDKSKTWMSTWKSFIQFSSDILTASAIVGLGPKQYTQLLS